MRRLMKRLLLQKIGTTEKNIAESLRAFHVLFLLPSLMYPEIITKVDWNVFRHKSLFCMKKLKNKSKKKKMHWNRNNGHSTHYASSCHRAFALALPFAWNILSSLLTQIKFYSYITQLLVQVTERKQIAPVAWNISLISFSFPSFILLPGDRIWWPPS